MAVEIIHFIITGGTIDSYYDGSKDTVVPHKSSVIPDFINSLNLHCKAVFTQVCMKDSRNLTPKDLKHVLNIIEKSRHKKIIVTHGTYTMADTARYLKANLKKNENTIVITGSLIPIIGFSPSDAPFNLGFAIAKVLDLEPDVYVCMNGRVFTSDKVTKIISQGRFASLLG